MENNHRIELIQRMLDIYVPDPRVPLIYGSPFQLLVATVLSAQSSDTRVNTITPILFSIAPTAAELAKLSVEQISSIIAPCGLARRKAFALHTMAGIIAQRYGGHVPGSYDELEALPGVGHKTASCIIANLFHQPAFPVDRHIMRVARRWGLSSGSKAEDVEADLKAQFKEDCWGRLHLQMVLYARRFCRARGHNIAMCPICRALSTEENVQEQLVPTW